MSTCPFCGRDPFHYVNNGIGMEAVAVDCCDLGDLYFRGDRPAPEEITRCAASTGLQFDRKENLYSSWNERATSDLIEALEFYANPDIYKPHPHGPAFDRRDLSFRARSALARARGETP